LPHAAPTSAPRGSTSTPAAAAPDVDLLGDPEQALAGNAAQADQLVGEGAADLKTRLAALRGHPSSSTNGDRGAHPAAQSSRSSRERPPV